MENIDFQEIYNDFLHHVESRIAEYVKIIEPVELYEPFQYIMSAGGKRIRPVLTMICAGAVGGNPENAISSGVAVEILHNFTLVHDDIMDNSPMRRNKPTIHEKWDEPTAILTGDVMVGFAYRLLPTNKDNANTDNIIKTFSNGLIDVCEGQAYDMQFNNRKDVTIDEYLLMITKKTARLLETSAVMGGYIGDGNTEQINALRNYANAMGLAFQIQDDLLDLTAEQEKLGKTIGQDIVEGKKTFLIIKAIEKAKDDKGERRREKEERRREKDIKLLDKFIRENGLPKGFIPKMQEMLERLGVLEDAQNLVEEYFQKADKELDILPDGKYTEMLRWLITKLNKRKY